MALTAFTPIYCGRSDGETDIRSKKYGRESNGPSSDQLDKVTNPEDYYEPLDHDHPITIEWKRQLGVMLQREMSAQSASPWFLMFFPENYRLFQHTKGSREGAGRFTSNYPVYLPYFDTCARYLFVWLSTGQKETISKRSRILPPFPMAHGG